MSTSMVSTSHQVMLDGGGGSKSEQPPKASKEDMYSGSACVQRRTPRMRSLNVV
jgi:hypothetical protein